MEEKPRYGTTPVICSAVVLLLGLTAFCCCVAAEFNKAKEEDMKLDGNLCSLPRTPAFGLGVAALVCLSVAQVIGTSAIGSRLRSRGKKPAGATAAVGGNPIVAITLLVLSWISFGLATILLGTGSSMNKGQPYGQGWLDGKCYMVNTGVYLGSAVLVVATLIFILGFTFTTTRKTHHGTGPYEQRGDNS